MLKRLTSRKFILAVVLTGASIGGLFTGHIGGTLWATVMGVILAAYGAANVAHKFVAPQREE